MSFGPWISAHIGSSCDYSGAAGLWVQHHHRVVLVLVDNHTDRDHFPAHSHKNFCEHMISRSSPAPENSPSEAGRLTARRVIARKETLSPWMGRLSMFQRCQAAFCELFSWACHAASKGLRIFRHFSCRKTKLALRGTSAGQPTWR